MFIFLIMLLYASKAPDNAASLAASKAASKALTMPECRRTHRFLQQQALPVGCSSRRFYGGLLMWRLDALAQRPCCPCRRHYPGTWVAHKRTAPCLLSRRFVNCSK